MLRISRLLTPEPSPMLTATCRGVYDPAQARIEAESVKAIIEKHDASDDPDFRTRAIVIKEQRSQLVKEHLGAVDRLLQAAALREVPPTEHPCSTRPPNSPAPAGPRGSMDPAVADQLLAKISEISDISGRPRSRDPQPGRTADPASSAYLSLARAATAGICARLDFPLDRLDDLTLAVDEAASLLLLDSRPGTELVCAWGRGHGSAHPPDVGEHIGPDPAHDVVLVDGAQCPGRRRLRADR